MLPAIKEKHLVSTRLLPAQVLCKFRSQKKTQAGLQSAHLDELGGGTSSASIVATIWRMDRRVRGLISLGRAVFATFVLGL